MRRNRISVQPSGRLKAMRASLSLRCAETAATVGALLAVIEAGRKWR